MFQLHVPVAAALVLSAALQFLWQVARALCMACASRLIAVQGERVELCMVLGQQQLKVACVACLPTCVTCNESGKLNMELLHWEVWTCVVVWSGGQLFVHFKQMCHYGRSLSCAWHDALPAFG